MRKLVILMMALLVGCGSSKDEDPEPTAPDMGEVDMPAEADMAPAVMCPIEGYLFCDDKCLDVSIDLEHCGACGNACTRGQMTCMSGECQCLGDGIMCEGECFDAFTSREHCGACGEACTSAEACVSGDCRPIAEDPRVYGVLVATNEGRAQQQDCGTEGLRPAVGPVQLNDLLNAAAQGHAEDMAANRFHGHIGSDGSILSDRTGRAGYMGSAVGENVAQGYENAESVVAGWIESDEHCGNLMNGRFDEMGVGYAESATGTAYWAQVFGAR